MIIQSVFFHDLIFMINHGLRAELMKGGNFTNIKAIHQTMGNDDLRRRQAFVRAVGAY